MYKKSLTVLMLFIFTDTISQNQPSIPALLLKIDSATNEEKIKIYNQVGFLYLTQDKYDSAIYYTELSLSVCKEIGDKKGIGDSYNNLGTIYRMTGQKEKAMENLVMALSIFEKNNFYKQSSKALGNISNIYMQQGNYNEAILKLLQAEKFSIKARDTLTLIDIYTTISENYRSLDELDQARSFINKGSLLVSELLKKSFTDKLDSVKFVYAKSYLNKASAQIYNREGKFKEAIMLFREEWEDSKKYDMAPVNKIDVLAGLGEGYYQMGNYDSALIYSDLAIALLKDDSTPMGYKNIYELRVKIFSKLGRFKDAYQSHVLYKQISDSINNDKTTRIIAELKTRYETEEKDAQILVLSKEKRSQRLIIGFAVGAVFVALGFLAFAYRAKKLQQRLFQQKEELILKDKEIETNALTKKMTELEQMALRAQMNPHFIFNSLNSVQHFVMNKDVEGVNKYLGAFAHLIRQTLSNSGKTLISLDEEIKYLDTYLSLEKMKSNDHFSYSIDVDENVEGTATFIPGMILQPFVENSIRHGITSKENKDGKINVHIAKNGKLVCEIEDNGVGRERAGEIKKLSAEGGYESKGMGITMNRIETINKIYGASISVVIEDLKDSNGLPSGTRVAIEFPGDME